MVEHISAPKRPITDRRCRQLRSRKIGCITEADLAATIACRFVDHAISSAIFDCSAPDLDSCPDESLPEFAFIGRSNVGKSSLLNLLSGKLDLARVSPTPGFTKLINIFTMNKTWRLVDLPGYGFAAGARKARCTVQPGGGRVT